MAQTTVTAKENSGKFKWQEDRREMATQIKQNILDPFALIAGMLTETDAMRHFCPGLEEVGRLLALMVVGAHSELDMYCSFGGHILGPDGGKLFPAVP